ncbi:MAG: family N-acetyltransferase [Verrucomicrobiaceae bacterium]|nr:family N-acetyltransferase [Verrucomicrobiaceae bacterium]
MNSELEILNVHGPQLEPFIDGLGRLRIEVFREYPYLYDGTLNYEREYLKSYLNSPRSLVALVLDQGEVVGATTCVPMADEGPEFKEAFIKGGYDVEDICYFGESILLPAYRGRGLGKEFFKRREAHAQTLGAAITTFCAVDRPSDHPLRPIDYVPLDGLWAKQGYVKHPELQAVFEWKEMGEAKESAKTLTFWLKHWA